jgi:hypothetical protein
VITQERLKELLEYDAETGKLFWRVSRGTTCAGDEAGYINNRGYVSIRIDFKAYLAHRLAWLYVHGTFPKDGIDHINGMTADNRLVNLRDVDHRTNLRNQRLSKTNSSGVTGVSWEEARQRWNAYITVDGIRTNLGYFVSLPEAKDVRKAAERLHGFHENHGRVIEDAQTT